MSDPNIRDAVKEKYGSAALRVTTGGSSCCGAAPATGCGVDPITSNLYDAAQSGEIPAEAMLASLGCGNPTALAKLNAGETVLDLGSGGGIDVLLSAKRVGPTGKAYGLDMTDEMLALANENKKKDAVVRRGRGGARGGCGSRNPTSSGQLAECLLGRPELRQGVGAADHPTAATRSRSRVVLPVPGGPLTPRMPPLSASSAIARFTASCWRAQRVVVLLGQRPAGKRAGCTRGRPRRCRSARPPAAVPRSWPAR